MPNDPNKIDMAEVLKTLRATNAALLATKGANSKARYPYYNSSSADEIKEAVLTVLKSRAPMMWPARDVSDQTLYNKWKQGSDYLLNVQEPEFKSTYQLVHCQRIPKHGLKISPVKIRSALNLLPAVEWRPDFTVFLDTSQHKDKFERVIPLSDEDIKWINEQLTGIEHMFITDINDTGLTIIRYDRQTTT